MPFMPHMPLDGAVRLGMKEAAAAQLRIQKRQEIPLELRLIDWARSETLTRHGPIDGSFAVGQATALS